ncbi:MAG: hypothetical protein JW806_04090 [Sedimentisphaerales bacterium]|nr:hypothetical protein [Sedimentisphaerales bacterium]
MRPYNIIFKRKNLLGVLIFIGVLFLIIFFAVPLYLSSNSGKNLILGKINNSIDGKVEVDSFSMGWFAGLKADKLNFTDNKGLMKLTAEQIAAQLKYLSLLGGKVMIDQAVIDKPFLTVTIDHSKPIQTEQSTKSVHSGKKASVPPLPLDQMDLTINDGNIRVSSLNADQTVETLEIKDINSKIAVNPPPGKSSFDVSMTVAGANEVSDITAVGEIKTAKKQWSLAGATGNLKIKVNDLELAALAPLFEIFDVNATAKGRVEADINAQMKNGLFENLQGTVNASDLDVSGSFLKGDRLQTSKLEADAKLSTTETSINIDHLKIETDGLTADVKGTVPKTLKSLEDFLKADSPDTLQGEFDCDLAKSLKQIKTISNFKEDFDIRYGRVSGTVNTEAKNGTRIVETKVKFWALEGKFPVKQIILSEPIDFEAKIVSRQETITIEKLIMDSSFVQAALNGTTDNMNYTADVDLVRFQADVGQFFEIKPKLQGTAKLNGKASLVNRILTSSGNASVSNIIITMPDGAVLSEPTASVGYNFNIDVDNKMVNAKKLDISAGPGKVNIDSFTIPLDKKTTAPTQFNTTFAVDLDKFDPWIKTFGKTNPKAQFAGFAKGDLSFKKSGDIIEASTKKTDIQNLKITSPGQEPFNQSTMAISFAGKFDTKNKIYDLKNLMINSPQINISGDITNEDLGTKTKTTGSLKANYDLAAASSIISPFTPSGFKATGKRNDSLWFSSTYPKNNPEQLRTNLNAQTTFGFDTAQYMGLDIGKSDFDVKIKDGIMTIAPFSTTVNKGKLNFAATADLTTNPPMLKTTNQMKIFDAIQINQQTTDALLKYVNPLFADAVDISGILNFDCQTLAFPLKKGYRNSIETTGILAIDNMRLGQSSLLGQIIQLTGASQDPVLTVQPTKLVLANGILRYDNMQMDFEDKSINFTGQIGLDKSMQMTVTLPWTHNGQRITLPLKGSVDKPEIDTAKLAEQILQKELERQAEKILEDIFK